MFDFFRKKERYLLVRTEEEAASRANAKLLHERQNPTVGQAWFCSFETNSYPTRSPVGKVKVEEM